MVKIYVVLLAVAECCSVLFLHISDRVYVCVCGCVCEWVCGCAKNFPAPITTIPLYLRWCVYIKSLDEVAFGRVHVLHIFNMKTNPILKMKTQQCYKYGSKLRAHIEHKRITFFAANHKKLIVFVERYM